MSECPNPKCGNVEDNTFFFEDGKFFLRCSKCGWTWRPSKVSNGVEQYR